jgi:hypothetical protein
MIKILKEEFLDIRVNGEWLMVNGKRLDIRC